MYYHEKIPTARRSQLTKHYVDLGMCFTDINYRRQGVAGMLMEWGINKADELGVECFLESTSIAVPLYQRFEYLIIDENEITAPIPNPSEEWKDLEKRYLPICSWVTTLVMLKVCFANLIVSGLTCGGQWKENMRKAQSILGR